MDTKVYVVLQTEYNPGYEVTRLYAVYSDKRTAEAVVKKLNKYHDNYMLDDPIETTVINSLFMESKDGP